MVKPKVSIIMCLYNSSKYVREALESILNQTYKDYEVIIVNDGSTDGSDLLVKHFIKKHHLRKTWFLCNINKNAGTSFCRNIGVHESSGEYILQFDSDDILDPNFLTLIIPYLESGEADIVACNVKLFGSVNCDWDMSEFGWSIEKFRQSNLLCITSPFRREIYEETGGYESGYLHEDMQWWVKACLAGYKLKRIPDYLFSYRQHSIQHTASVDNDIAVKQVNDFIDKQLGEKNDNNTNLDSTT